MLNFKIMIVEDERIFAADLEEKLSANNLKFIK